MSNEVNVKLEDKEQYIYIDMDHCKKSDVMEFKRHYKEDCGSSIVLTCITDKYINLEFNFVLESKVHRVLIGDKEIYNSDKEYEVADNAVQMFYKIKHRKGVWIDNEDSRRDGRFWVNHELPNVNGNFKVFGLDLNMFDFEELPGFCLVTFKGGE